MRLVKPEHRNAPPNIVHFEVSSQMTRLDVKNYLTQIYKIPAMDVKTFNFSGENFWDCLFVRCKYVTVVIFLFRHLSKLSLHLYKVIATVLISSYPGIESSWGLNNFT